ncbi:MAG TPA: DUF1269 domain-containing protein [Anaerolineae bacterium]|nr:DUF1269 domain-containing protein [Anaerolineae bacterium]
MSQLVVFAFRDETGAEQMRDALVGLQKQQLIELVDAAVAVRKQDGKVKVKQAVSLVGAGALGGAFWGMFIGLLFWMPWLGLAIGAASGALGGALSDTGVDDKFIKEVAASIDLGGSALFLLINSWTEDKVMDALTKFDAQVLQTSLSKDDEAKLRAAFGADEE